MHAESRTIRELGRLRVQGHRGLPFHKQLLCTRTLVSTTAGPKDGPRPAFLKQLSKNNLRVQKDALAQLVVERGTWQGLWLGAGTRLRQVWIRSTTAGSVIEPGTITWASLARNCKGRGGWGSTEVTFYWQCRGSWEHTSSSGSEVYPVGCCV